MEVSTLDTLVRSMAIKVNISYGESLAGKGNMSGQDVETDREYREKKEIEFSNDDRFFLWCPSDQNLVAIFDDWIREDAWLSFWVGFVDIGGGGCAIIELMNA